MTGEDNNQRMLRAGGWMLLALCVGFAIWQASNLVLVLLEPTPQPGALLTTSNTNPEDRVPVASAADYHLFGQSNAIDIPITAFAAPETTLDLTLMGTVAAPDPKEGFAIIADGEGGEGYYSVGDDILSQAEVHEVYSNRVILNRSGVLETLSLREDKLDTEPTQRTVRSRPQSNQSNRGRQPVVQSGPNNQVAAGPAAVDWSAIKSQKIDTAKLASQIRAIPFSENGKNIGVRLQAGRDAKLMQQLGLQPNDVVTAVNGIPLDDPKRSFELMRLLNSETSFNVNLRRNGRDMTLNINLNQ